MYTGCLINIPVVPALDQSQQLQLLQKDRFRIVLHLGLGSHNTRWVNCAGLEQIAVRTLTDNYIKSLQYYNNKAAPEALSPLISPSCYLLLLREVLLIPHHSLLMSSVAKLSPEKLRGQLSAYVPSRLKYASSLGISNLKVGHALFPSWSNHFVT